jgi:HD superfamily phosphodiesterase
LPDWSSSTTDMRTLKEKEGALLGEKDFQGIRETILAQMKSVPAHHGAEHVLLVEEFGTLVGLREGGNVSNIRLGGLLHDLRWWDEEERKVRKIAVSPAEGIDSPEETLRKLYVAGKITPADYGDIVRAVRRHNRLGDAGRLTTKCVQDADRLSRSGIAGLRSILEANQDYGVPFYNDGAEIIRPPDAPLMPFSAIKSCVDDINSCLDWEKVMSTTTGRRLAPRLNSVNRRFLETFSHMQNIADYDVWLTWLRQQEQVNQPERKALRQLLEQRKVDEYEEALVILEDPKLVSLENFLTFQK